MDRIEEFIVKRNKEKEEKEQLQGIQNNLGKLHTKELVDKIFDEGSFVEINKEMQGNVVTGYGTVDGILVYTYMNDYTQNGGIINDKTTLKICNVLNMAAKVGAAVLAVFDSIGSSLEDEFFALKYYNDILSTHASLSGVVTQYALVAGPCTGALSIAASLCDFTIAVNNSSELYLNCPEDLSDKENKYISLKDYAQGETLIKNGNASILVNSQDEAIEIFKNLIECIPSNSLETIDIFGEVEFSDEKEELNEIAKSTNKDYINLSKTILDHGSFININGNVEDDCITGLGKINGKTVGLCTIGGSLNISKINKLIKHVKTSNAFNLPIIMLVDSEGFVLDVEEENRGLAGEAGRLVNVLAQSSVPKISIVMGKAYGNIFSIFGVRGNMFDYVYLWPTAEVCITNPIKLIKMLYKDRILSSSNPKEEESKVVEEKINEVTDIYKVSEAGLIDGIILPSETSMIIYSAIDTLATKRIKTYPKNDNSFLV